MDTTEEKTQSATAIPFFERPEVKVENIPVGPGVPLGIERIFNPGVGVGGAYGTWGDCYDNTELPELLKKRLGEEFSDKDNLNLGELGFFHRHHITELSEKEHEAVELEVGKRMLEEATKACGWRPEEVDAVLLGVSGPTSNDYTERIARAAGIPEDALKVSVHKACDGAVAGLHLALNPDLEYNHRLKLNLGEELKGKKVLVGGIEGLSRFMRFSRDKFALQLFGNGAGVIGVVPGETLKFLAGKSFESFDEEGVLMVRMFYPHSKHATQGDSMTEVSQAGEHHLRVAGMMHEPESEQPLEMAGPMGMVKLFVRNGVQVVHDTYLAYKQKMADLGIPGKDIVVGVVHHANYKINQLKEKHLQREGIQVHMPWVMNDFGNVSAASTMIAFLRQLRSFNPGDHILIDGFGAGTYYDVMAVEMGS